MPTESANYALLRRQGIGHRAASQIDRVLGRDECSQGHWVMVGIFLLIGDAFAYQFHVTSFRAREISRIPLTSEVLRLDLSGNASLREGYDWAWLQNGGFELVSGDSRIRLETSWDTDRVLDLAETGVVKLLGVVRP